MTPEHLRDVLLPWAAPLRGPRSGDWLSENIEVGQSLTEFIKALPKTGNIDRDKVINIFRIDGSDRHLKSLPKSVTDPMTEILSAYFPGIAFVFPDPPYNQPDVPPTMRPAKGKYRQSQWCAVSLVSLASNLRESSPRSAFAVTVLTGTDLFTDPNDPEDWLFGFADFEKGGLCVSWNRCKLDGEDFSRSRRFVSLLLHEICHVLYMQHCVSFDCLMNGVNNDDELQAQSLHLCPECHAKLFQLLRFDPLKRLASLWKMFGKFAWNRDVSLAANLLTRLTEAPQR